MCLREVLKFYSFPLSLLSIIEKLNGIVDYLQTKPTVNQRNYYNNNYDFELRV